MYTLHACVRVSGVIGDAGLTTTLMLFSEHLKLPSLHQVSVRLPGNQGSGVPERRCLFPTNDSLERTRMGGGEKEIHRLVNGRPSLEGPGINASASSLCLSTAIFLSASASVSHLAHSDLRSLLHHSDLFCIISF